LISLVFIFAFFIESKHKTIIHNKKNQNVINFIFIDYWTSWNEGDALALFNWKSHLIILALRSITDNDVDGTTVLLLFDGLLALLSSVVWSENDNRLTLSNAPESEQFVVEAEVDIGGVEDRNGRSKASNSNRSCLYS
jgi:hypothetical protein